MTVTSTDIDRERARRLPRPGPHVIVLFGATGDLARRKLIPGLFHLQRVGLMPEDYRIVGSTMEDLGDDEFRERAHGALDEFCRMEIGGEDWEEFSARLAFAPARADTLADGVARAEEEIGTEARRLHYLSVPPAAAGSFVRTLG
jgi:glucose-6-phosphate 1-dehydrogenase